MLPKPERWYLSSGDRGERGLWSGEVETGECALPRGTQLTSHDSSQHPCVIKPDKKLCTSKLAWVSQLSSILACVHCCTLIQVESNAFLQTIDEAHWDPLDFAHASLFGGFEYYLFCYNKQNVFPSSMNYSSKLLKLKDGWGICNQLARSERSLGTPPPNLRWYLNTDSSIEDLDLKSLAQFWVVE